MVDLLMFIVACLGLTVLGQIFDHESGESWQPTVWLAMSIVAIILFVGYFLAPTFPQPYILTLPSGQTVEGDANAIVKYIQSVEPGPTDEPQKTQIPSSIGVQE